MSGNFLTNFPSYFYSLFVIKEEFQRLSCTDNCATCTTKIQSCSQLSLSDSKFLARGKTLTSRLHVNVVVWDPFVSILQTLY